MEKFTKFICSRIEQKKKKKSGDGTTWKTYVFFDQLSFLMRCPSNKETSSNITEDPTENNETLLSEDNGETMMSYTPISKKRKNTSTDDSSEMVTVLKASLEQRQRNEDLLEKDEDRHFLLSLLADFKRVPVEKKLDVKLAIIQAIKSAIFTTHGAPVPHTPYFSETYPMHPSAFFTPPQPYSNIPHHFNQIPQSPHTSQQNNPIPQPHTSQQINQIPQSPQTSQQNNPIPQSSHTSQQNYQLPQFPSTQHNLQQKILTPLQSPYSVESSDNMSTDGSLVDLLQEY